MIEFPEGEAPREEPVSALDALLKSADEEPGIIIVEDCLPARARLVDGLKERGFQVYAAPNLEEAYKVIDFYKRMDLALVDDKIPRIKGSRPVRLADKLFSRFVEKFPGIKIFAYADEPAKLRKPYAGIFPKQACPASVCHMIHDYVKNDGHKH